MPEQPKIVTIGLLSEAALQQLGSTFRSRFPPLPADDIFVELLGRLDQVDAAAPATDPGSPGAIHQHADSSSTSVTLCQGKITG
jgi:hypothetical protein